MNTMWPIHQRAGWTLVEILAVVVVLAVLVAMLLPNLRAMMERATVVGCANGMRSFAAGALAYATDHDGYLPPGRLLPPITDDNQNPQSAVDVAKELKDGGYLPELPSCPAQRLTEKGLDYIKKNKMSERQFHQKYGSYAINCYLLQIKPLSLPGQYWPTASKFAYPGNNRMPFIVESTATLAAYSFSHVNQALDGMDTGGNYAKPRSHGNHRLNFMFMDMHMELLAPKVTTDSSGKNTYDWDEVFSSWGEEGKFITLRRARAGD